MFAFEFEVALFAFTYATPPFGFAELFERFNTREPLPVSTCFLFLSGGVLRHRDIFLRAGRGKPLHPTLYDYSPPAAAIAAL